MQLSHFETPDGGYLVIGTHDVATATEYLHSWRAGMLRRKNAEHKAPAAIPEYVTPRKVKLGEGRTAPALEFTQ